MFKVVVIKNGDFFDVVVKDVIHDLVMETICTCKRSDTATLLCNLYINNLSK